MEKLDAPNPTGMEIDKAIDWLQRPIPEPKHRIHRYEPWKVSAVVRSKDFKKYRERLAELYKAQNTEV